MKKIGLVVATENEFNAIFKSTTAEHEILETEPFLIYKLKLGNNEIIAINCGIGEIYSAITTEYLITKYKVDFILNYGVVGSLSDSLSLNSTVTIDKIFDYQYDVSLIDNVEVGFHTELNSLYVKTNQNVLDFMSKNFKDIPQVTCASGNQFITDVKIKENLANKYGCSICEMESLGIALTCLKNNVDFLFIKGVSDSKTGGAEEYKKMVDESSLKTYKILEKIAKTID